MTDATTVGFPRARARARLPAKPLALAALGISCALGSIAVAAPAESASAFLASTSLFGSSKVAVLRLEMKISRQGSVATRELELSIDRAGGGYRSLARIVSPAFLSGMKYLKVLAPGQPDAQWVKTSRGLRRLGVANRGESVFDSDFTAEDFGAIGAEGFDLAFAPARDDEARRAIEATPKGPAPYASRLVFVDRSTSLVVGMEYLDAAGKTLRRYRVTEIEGSGQAAHPVAAIMEDLKTGGSTALRVLSFATPASLPERTFNPNAL